MASPQLKKTEVLMEKLIPDLTPQERAVLLARNEKERFLSPEEIKLAVKFDTPDNAKEFLRILSLHTKRSKVLHGEILGKRKAGIEIKGTRPISYRRFVREVGE